MSVNNTLKAHFYGVRGSLPKPALPQEVSALILEFGQLVAQKKLQDPTQVSKLFDTLPPHKKTILGGNTSCVMATYQNHYFIFDAGSGIRTLSEYLMKDPNIAKGKGVINIILSHTHWDHIMGLPFFTPLFIPGNQIRILGVHDELRERINNQHHPFNYPLALDFFKSEITFESLQKNSSFQLADGVELINYEQTHPGKSFGYRINAGGKSLVYATDSEFRNISIKHLTAGQNIFSNADLLIFDSQFTLKDSIERYDWGHSTAMVGIDLSVRENVKRMALFHHDHFYSDEKIFRNLEDARNYLLSMYPEKAEHLQLMMAQEGEVIDL